MRNIFIKFEKLFHFSKFLISTEYKFEKRARKLIEKHLNRKYPQHL